MSLRNSLVLTLVIGALVPLYAHAADTISLFNGKDLSSFYTFIKDRGKNTDPQKVFTVKDGVIRISGEEWGCITSNDEVYD